MPFGLRAPSQLDSGHLLLLGPCGNKVREEKAQGRPWDILGRPSLEEPQERQTTASGTPIKTLRSQLNPSPAKATGHPCLLCPPSGWAFVPLASEAFKAGSAVVSLRPELTHLGEELISPSICIYANKVHC